MTPPEILNTVWQTLIGSLLLLLLALGLWRLVHTLKTPHKGRIAHAYMAFALTLFVAYDFSVYQKFVQEFPYTPTPVGAGRFVLDVLMTFCIYLMMNFGMSAKVWSAGSKLALSLAAWHVLAICWHMMANVERHLMPLLPRYAPHAIISTVYLAGYAIDQRIKKQPLEGGYRRYGRQFLVGLATVVIGFSVFRLWQMR